VSFVWFSSDAKITFYCDKTKQNIETADIITFISDIFIEKLKGSDTTKQVSPYIKSFE
jgi:hypothetical protein